VGDAISTQEAFGAGRVLVATAGNEFLEESGGRLARL
jgi:hypothetical protein